MFSKKQLKMYLKSENGSTTVFIGIILVALMTVSISLIILTREKVYDGKVDSISSLSARSVLSKYNKPLLDHYGIMSLNKFPDDIEKEFKFYMGENGIDIGNLTVDESNYLLFNIDVFEKEINDYYKNTLIKNLTDKSEDNGSASEDVSGNVLRNKTVIAMLPSKDTYNVSDIDKASLVDMLKSNNISRNDKFLLGKFTSNEYALAIFTNHLNKKRETSFFKNEIEYILTGKFNDEDNYKSVRRKIFLAREIINAAEIIAIPELDAEVTAMASLGGPFEPAVKATLVAVWATFETSNDLKILEHGGKIPIKKNKDSWATDIKSAVEGIDNGYIDNKAKVGLSYKDYLRILLALKDKNLILYRMMDLIQINIQGYYDEEFLIKSSATGFAVNFSTNGRKYIYDEKYH
ncbi:MAG: DUF5702 domain-containing protein [Eubacteriales bacterium]|nr:DUF5702 domain-containing protein [Eubacteriales bacterium]MDY3332588.1 DUF5702 domain-containing protein [Gallibacter sp.]